MKLVRYSCSHCGRKFEAEEKDHLECPGCYWSTSVKREDGPQSADRQTEADEEFSRSPQSFKKNNINLTKFLPALIAVLIMAVAVYLGLPKVQSFLKKPSGGKAVHIEPEKKKKSKKPSELAEKSTGLAVLTPEEVQVLQTPLVLAADREPDEKEQKALSFRASFQTGLVQKLPSQAWTLENFKELIASQEKAYKVPLPGSYKGKLEKVFKEKYVPAQAAFEQGDLVSARNLWVESLAFPVYANNVQKHRGVVLTMLRPFINDTLSKIGAINRAIVEAMTRDKEQVLAVEYQKLFDLIGQRSWPEALALTGKLEQMMGEIEKNNTGALQPPPYTDSVKLVDDGIKATLFEMLTPPPYEMADLAPLQQDLQQKRRIMAGLIKENLEKALGHYQTGMNLVQNQDWNGAKQELAQVDLPDALVQDAQLKIKMIDKILKSDASLDDTLNPSVS